MIPSALRSSGTMPTPAPDRGGRRPAPPARAVDADRAGVDRVRAEDGLGRLGAARSRAARPGRRPRRRARRRLTPASSVPAGEPGGPQHRLAGRRRGARRRSVVAPCSRTSSTSRPSMVATSRSRVVSGDRAGVHEPAVAQHGDPLADPEHLVELVRHVQHGDLPARAARRSRSASRSTSRGSSDDVGSSMITTRASVDSARATATICCTPRPSSPSRRADVDGDAVPGQRSRGASRCMRRKSMRPNRLVGSRPRNRLLATLSSGHQVDLLVDGADPGGLRVAGLGEGDRLAQVAHLAAVRPVHAGDDLDQRRLAGAVLADQRVHLAGLQRRARRRRGRARRRTACDTRSHVA